MAVFSHACLQFSHYPYTMAGVTGKVVAWQLGPDDESLGSPDFELFTSMRDGIPGLVTMSSSTATLDGKRYLLHPVVTCLASKGLEFSSPLRLRFPVGDEERMNAGSDDEDGIVDKEEAYKKYLREEFGVLVQEEGGKKWGPCASEVVQVGKTFFLQVLVPHFTKFSVARPINENDNVAIVDTEELDHKSRKCGFLFVNNGFEKDGQKQDVTVLYRDSSESKFKPTRFGAALSVFQGGEVNVEGNWTDSGTRVFSCEIEGGNSEERILSIKSTVVVWVTQQVQEEGHRMVQIWGKRRMDHKKAIVFKQCSGSPLVRNLRVNDGENLEVVVCNALDNKTNL
ncbi:unnamed protein product [Choristocarpus tenellus]